MHRHLLPLLPCVLLFACATTPRSTAASNPVSAPGKPAPAPDTAYDFSDELVERAMSEQREAKPVRLRCELFYRESAELAPGDTGSEAKYQHVSRVLDLGPGEGDTVSLGTVTLGAQYFDSMYEGSSFTVSVSAGEQHLYSVLYQFSRAAPPAFEFSGEQGFTGLVYVTSPHDGGDYQYVCKVPAEARR